MDLLKSIQKFFQDNPRMWMISAIALIFAGAMALWAFSGSSVNVGQLFAAGTSQCGYVDKDLAECQCHAVQTGETLENKIIRPHVCTRSFGEGNTDYKDQNWWDWDLQGGNANCPDDAPYVTEKTKADGTSFGTPNGCVEKPPDCPSGYYAFGASTCNQGSPGGTTTSPVTSVAPGAAVFCSPQTQNVAVGQIASLQATGGTGAFAWNVTGSGIVQQGGNQTIGISYSVAGQKVVRVSSGGSSAACTVIVGSTSPTATAAASPSPSTSVQVSPTVSTVMTLSKTARNTSIGDQVESTTVTVNPDQIAQFTIQIINTGTTTLNNLTVYDAVPSGMSFQTSSVLVNWQPAFDESVVSGLKLGSLDAGNSMTVQWSAIADQTVLLAPGPQYFQSTAQADADGAPEVTATVNVTVYGSGTSGGTVATPTPTGTATGASGVPTGPGDAITIALLVAAALTLLYSGYTRSVFFRRHEADIISSKKDPMDFRS